MNIYSGVKHELSAFPLLFKHQSLVQSLGNQPHIKKIQIDYRTIPLHIISQRGAKLFFPKVENSNRFPLIAESLSRYSELT